MYQSIPSLTIPPGAPQGNFFERANSPQRKCETPTPGVENCAKTPLSKQLFSKIQQKKNMRQK